MSSRKPAAPVRPTATLRQLEKTSVANDANQASTGGRRRSNSQSQVMTAPLFLGNEQGVSAGGRPTLTPIKQKGSGLASRPQKRHQAEYYVTLALLNDTFPTKHIHVPFYPDTCKLGRPTGTKVKPHVSNGYFDSRVLSRNHACMFVDAKLGLVMVQDMGLSNGTFVNLDKLGAEPVAINVGDTLNLGFNIQVETNHKQISAKIEAINVVSNSPQGPVHDVFPGLTKLAVGNFGDADMRHYEFLQQLCTQLTPGGAPAIPENNPDGSTDSDPRRQATRAFDYGMFSDIVPSLNEVFESTASQQDVEAGLYPNSGIRPSPELLSTLDYLSASLAKIKHQNSILTSLDVFFHNYSARVDEINSRYVQEQITKHESDRAANLQKEKEKSEKASQDQDTKLEAQARLVTTLESEITRLKAELETASQPKPEIIRVADQTIETSPSETEEKPVPKTLDPSFTTSDLSLENSVDLQKEPVKPAKAIFPGAISEETDSTTSSTLGLTRAPPHSNNFNDESNIIPESSIERDTLSESTENTAASSHTDSEQLHNVLGPYKNQGVLVGFLVVIAGLIYLNSRST